MAATASPKTAPGARLPAFSLPDVTSGDFFSPASFSGASGLLVAFICRHCPYVVHMRDELGKIAGDFRPRGLRTVGICSNDSAAYPDDAPERLREMGLPFPILHDDSQDVARAFGAVCTPDLFLYDSQGGLYYRGRLDESSPGNNLPVTGAELRRAVLGLLAGEPPPEEQLPSIGCSIKWRRA